MKVTDLVCKMTIEDSGAVATSTYKGVTYYFCSTHCKNKFDSNPDVFLVGKAPEPLKTGVIYTCPMHPEIKQEEPGSCPKCGMALEPVTPLASSKTKWTCPMHPEIVGIPLEVAPSAE